MCGLWAGGGICTVVRYKFVLGHGILGIVEGSCEELFVTVLTLLVVDRVIIFFPKRRGIRHSVGTRL